MSWMLDNTTMENHAARLRLLLDYGEALTVPGVFNPPGGLAGTHADP